MKHPFRSHLLPWFPLGAGILGLALRLWLFSAIDEKGLLPTGHIADPLLYLLTGLTLGILFLSTRELLPKQFSKEFYRLSGIIACLLGALGLCYSSILEITTATVRIPQIVAMIRIIGGVTLLCMALLRYFHKKVPYWANAVITVVLMLHAVSQCRIWGSTPQLQEYFFPLLASVFLILTAYQATAVSAGQEKVKLLAFFSQGAAFLCCLSLNTAHWPMYLGMLFWAAAQIIPCIRTKKEA